MANFEPSPYPTSSLLSLPKEIRLLIYNHLFTTPTALKIEPDNSFTFVEYAFRKPPSDAKGFSNSVFRLAAHAHPLSSQILRINNQIRDEALPLLYSLNDFDCTTRDGVMLLLTSLSSNSFANIASLIIDWDQLLDFSFQLAKPGFVELTSNLTCLTMAHWRTRILRGSSLLWRDVKSYERTLVQAALAITEKSKSLKFVAEHHWVGKYGEIASPRRVTLLGPGRGEAASDRMRKDKEKMEKGIHPLQTNPTHMRVKWRFLASECRIWEKETLVDLHGEMEMLAAKGEEGEYEGSVQGALDPF